MEGFRTRLTQHTRVGLDTSIFIYHLENHPRYQSLTQELLSGIETGQQDAVTSVITVMELTVRPWQIGRPSVAREYETLLLHFPNLVLVDVNREVARRAAQLRARHRIRPADAIQRVRTADVELKTGANLAIRPSLVVAREDQSRMTSGKYTEPPASTVM